MALAVYLAKRKPTSCLLLSKSSTIEVPSVTPRYISLLFLKISHFPKSESLLLCSFKTAVLSTDLYLQRYDTLQISFSMSATFTFAVNAVTHLECAIFLAKFSPSRVSSGNTKLRPTFWEVHDQPEPGPFFDQPLIF